MQQILFEKEKPDRYEHKGGVCDDSRTNSASVNDEVRLDIEQISADGRISRDLSNEYKSADEEAYLSLYSGLYSWFTLMNFGIRCMYRWAKSINVRGWLSSGILRVLGTTRQTPNKIDKFWDDGNKGIPY